MKRALERVSRRALRSWTSAALLLFAGAASANVAAPPPPAILGAPAAQSTSPIVVLGEKLRITCADTGIPSSCSFTAEYRLHNPTSAPITQIAGFVGVNTSVERAALDEQELAMDLTEDESNQVLGASKVDYTGANVARGFRVRLAAGEQRTLKVEGALLLQSQTPRGYTTIAGYARHLALGDPDARDVYFTLRYLIAPIHTWGGDPLIDIELRVPARWDVEVSGLSPALPSTYRSSAQASATADHIEMRARRPSDRLALGGVLLGIGGSTGTEGAFRLRAGAEVVTFGLLTAFAYETDARRRHTLVPTVGVATSMLAFLPSLGFGLGVPVRVAPESRVGGRVQFDLHFGPVGFLTTLDFYPPKGARDAVVEPAFLFQVGL